MSRLINSIYNLSFFDKTLEDGRTRREHVISDGKTRVDLDAYTSSGYPGGFSDSQDMWAQDGSDAVKSATPEQLFAAGLRERAEKTVMAAAYLSPLVVGAILLVGEISKGRGQ